MSSQIKFLKGFDSIISISLLPHSFKFHTLVIRESEYVVKNVKIIVDYVCDLYANTPHSHCLGV